jgi:hypothetical protein
MLPSLLVTRLRIIFQVSWETPAFVGPVVRAVEVVLAGRMASWITSMCGEKRLLAQVAGLVANSKGLDRLVLLATHG